MKKQELYFKGNKELLDHPKTAFFCSRNTPATVISKSYDWAIDQKNKENCIISGFHSQIERDVLHFLLKGDQPIITVLARSMYKRLPDKGLKGGIDKGNLLLVSPFRENVKRASSSTAQKRNVLMIDLADDIMVAYASKGGSISKLLPQMKASHKMLYTLDVEENDNLLQAGFSTV